jgi:hypothetical protein
MALGVSFDEFTAFIGIVGGLLVAVGIVQQYRASVTLRRAEWLYKLYHEFYVEPHLKEIRDAMDKTGPRARIEEMLRKPPQALDEKQTEELFRFTDYLNFFEFTMFLLKIKALNETDVDDMFDYYLGLLSGSEAIMAYLRAYGYSLLFDYLGRKRKAGKQ